MDTVPLNELVLDFDIYPRTEISASNVKLLREAKASGVVLPAIIVDRASKRIVDGFHRFRAAQSDAEETIDVEWRDYPDEATLYEDAIVLNRGHGLPLQRYDLQRAIARLEKLGYERDRIAAIVLIPIESIERITSGFGKTRSGDAIPIKRGLDHLRGTTLTKKNEKANEGYAGFPAAFYVRQVRLFLDTHPPITADFAEEMNKLFAAWTVDKSA